MFAISVAPGSSQFPIEVNEKDRKSEKGRSGGWEMSCRDGGQGGVQEHGKLSRRKRINRAWGKMTSKVKPDWPVWT